MTGCRPIIITEKQSDWIKKPMPHGGLIIYDRNETGIAVSYSDKEKQRSKEADYGST